MSRETFNAPDVSRKSRFLTEGPTERTAKKAEYHGPRNWCETIAQA